MIFSSFKWKSDKILNLSQPKSAYIYYKNKRLNLLTGREEALGINVFFKEFEKLKLETFLENARVIHFFFETGYILFNLDLDLNENEPLVIDIIYSNSKFHKLKNKAIKSINLKSLQRPTWKEYRDSFNLIQDHLLNGNCYQVNLTYPFDFFCEDFFDPKDLSAYLMSRNGVGSYAHLTYFDETILISNSPECLFHFENDKIFSLPIKGTIKRSHSFKSQWNKLASDKKQEAELFMIIDLLKNDLNKINIPNTNIRKLKAPLIVPGLIHQYAHLELDTPGDISLEVVVRALFPGGSITGAPKKKVMTIISEVEGWRRGFYTGSTLLCFREKKISNINIRSASINLLNNEWRYGAGGGITLRSRAAQEFNEMESKVDSFLTLLKGGQSVF